MCELILLSQRLRRRHHKVEGEKDMERMTSKLTVAFVVLLLCATAVTTASAQNQTADDLAAKREAIANLASRGEAIANADPLSVELRNQQPDEASRRGFDIGMAAAEGQTLPGPGKQRLHDSLDQAERGGFSIAVSFSLERNRNAKFAAIGAAIANVDKKVAEARNAEPDFRYRAASDLVFYRLGFDIATGIFGNPALGAQGNTATGPGSLGIRDALSAAGQRGFNAAVKLHLGVAPPSSAPERGPRGSGATDLNSPYGQVYNKNSDAAGARLADLLKPGPEPPSNEIRCRGFRGVGMFTAENSKIDSTRETIITILLTSEPGPYAAGPRGEGLRPGECSWVDRPIDVRNVNERWFLMRFETPANAQLKQKLHGSQVDTSPTAAERYPDARTIPAYMNDPNHYWSFFGVKKVDNFYVTTGHGYFKPPLRDRDRVLIPKKPE